MKISEMLAPELAHELHLLASEEEFKAEESEDYSSEQQYIRKALILRKAARCLLGSEEGTLI